MTRPPPEGTPLPAEALLIRSWREKAGINRTELARRITDLRLLIPDQPHEFSIPEATLRNMEKGSTAALRPTWRLAAAALICGGTERDLRMAGRDDAADELIKLEALYERADPEAAEALRASEATARVVVRRQTPSGARASFTVPVGLSEERIMAIVRWAEQMAKDLHSQDQSPDQPPGEPRLRRRPTGDG